MYTYIQIIKLHHEPSQVYMYVSYVCIYICVHIYNALPYQYELQHTAPVPRSNIVALLRTGREGPYSNMRGSTRPHAGAWCILLPELQQIHSSMRTHIYNIR